MPSTWPTVCGGIYSLCGVGARQSPIDINTSAVVKDPIMALTPLDLTYGTVRYTHVVHLGTTIFVEPAANNTIQGGPLPANASFNLQELHFHAPGEHRINGAASGAEVHFVHRDSNNETAIVVVRVQEGESNPWFDVILQVRNDDNTMLVDLNPLRLFPSDVLTSQSHLTLYTEYYYYNGSLTTPPCTEGVRWIVLAEPVFASLAQIQSLVHWEGIHNRPIQPYQGTVYRPYLEHPPVTIPIRPPQEDIRYLGTVIGISFLLGLLFFFGTIGIAILALYIRDGVKSRSFYDTQEFEMRNAQHWT